MGYYATKPVADEVFSFSIFDLKRYGLLYGLAYRHLSWTSHNQRSVVGIGVDLISSFPCIRLNYSMISYDDGKKEDFKYKIELTTTNCNFGGERYWFVCHCGERVGKLFMHNGYFRCRFCISPIYKSQLQNPKSRNGLYARFDIADRVDKLERSTKTRFYADKPTRKQRRIYKLYAQLSKYNRMEL